MPATKLKKGAVTRGKVGGDENKQLSARTRKQIDSLPEHAQHIFKKAHANAIEQYRNPEKRRGGKRQSVEQVAHKVAWAAVKKEYEKRGNEWVRKDDA
ncbi:MAG TPA: ChaB family protein [Candidatus Nitrosopolaris sp.]|nr:ChaB family protein [Candidatus Nitrosopolaris sp.]